MYPKGQVQLLVFRKWPELPEWQIQGMWPCQLRPMDATFVRNTDPTAILSRFPSPLLNRAVVYLTRFAGSQVLGPEIDWRTWRG